MSVAFSDHHIRASDKLNTDKSAVNNLANVEIPTNDPIIDIHVSAKDIIQLDVGSPSDPMCVLFIKENDKYVEFDRTEVVWNSSNPIWVKFFRSIYIFESQQQIRIAIYDADDAKAALNQHDFVGYIDTDIQTLVSSLGQSITLDLLHPTEKNRRGTITIVPEQENQCFSNATISVSVANLMKVNTFSKNNPYVVISRPSESGRLLPVYRTEVFPKCFRCQFKEFTSSIQSLCNGDPKTPLTISVYNYSSKGEDKLIGETSYSLESLTEKLATPLPLSNNSSKGKSKKPLGTVTFHKVSIVRETTFLDYLRSGLQLNLITAIDYTASNGDPKNPRSLHFLSNSYNQYEICINEVGRVVCPYDTDQHFPVYGFGAKIGSTIQHCFPLTFNPSNPNVAGLNGILAAYRDSLTKLQLSGPTLFAPVITAATEVARISFQQCKTYTILMILTDGVINDKYETIDAIVKASDAPLSIIIVGIGGADFRAMDDLDGDLNPLVSSGGEKIKRDIVQFVPFSKYLSRNGMGLSSEILAEIPKQVDQFCKSHGFNPTFI